MSTKERVSKMAGLAHRRFCWVACFLMTAAVLGQSTALSDSYEELQRQQSALRRQFSMHRKAGQAAEALKTAGAFGDVQRRMLALAREPGFDAKASKDLLREQIKVLEWVARNQESQASLNREETLREEVLQLTRELWGESHWRVVDARLAIDNVRRMQQLSDPERAELRKITMLTRDLRMLDAQRKYGEAIQIAEQIRELRSRILGVDHPDYARSLHSLGGLHDKNGEAGRAKDLSTKALDARAQILGEGHPDFEATLVTLAPILQRTGDYESAAERYEQLLGLVGKRVGENRREYAAAASRLANAYQASGRYDDAGALYRTAEKVLRQQVGEGHADYAASLNNLGILYRTTGDFARAEESFQQAIDILDALRRSDDAEGLRPNYATYAYNLARLYERTGEYAKAEPLAVEALEIRTNLSARNDSDCAEALNILALLQQRMGDHAKALENFVKATEMVRQAKGDQHPEYATALCTLAFVHQETGNDEQAFTLMEQALEIRERTLGARHPHVADSLDRLSKLYRLKGEYSQAERLHRRALKIYENSLGKQHPSYAWSLHRLGTTSFLMGKTDQAEAAWKEALQHKLQIARQSLPWLPEAQALAFLTQLTSDDSSCGRDPLLSAYRLRPTRDEHAAYDAVWETRGLVLRTLTERRRRLAESPESALPLKRLGAVQQQLAHLAFVVTKPDQMEDRRQRLANLNAEKERLERELARLSQRHRQGVQAHEATPADLAKFLPSSVAVVDIIQTNAWQSPADGQHRPSKNRVYEAFVIRRDDGERGYSVRWVPLGAAENIDKMILAWRRQIQRDAVLARGRRLRPRKPSHESYGDVPQRLRQSIWNKVEPYLAGVTTVVLVPDGALHRLPWAALPGRSADSYLIEDYALATCPSGQQIYAQLTADPVEGQEALLVGGVDYDRRESPAASPNTPATKVTARSGSDSWRYLSGTLQEVEAVGALRSPDSALTQLTDVGASESSVRRLLPGSRFVHLATHGFFADEQWRSSLGFEQEDEQVFGRRGSDLATAGRSGVTLRNPLLLCGVVLAGANLKASANAEEPIDDGTFTAEEVVSLDLRNTELVVLSACETGLGNVGGGEGVFGLQRAFHLAGTRATIASLWKVDDAATRALMIEFYRNLWHHKRSKLESLREAQRTILDRYDAQSGRVREATDTVVAGRQRVPPYYWAAFALTGDWR